ncbi:tryptophan synthase subunit alpha [Micrococcales bacterium 31B]|nr:tryptophan synthase subunit alpha [Micrococcales bacterium 31B]
MSHAPEDLTSTGGLRTTAALRVARREGRAALVGYLPVGYPSVEASIEAARAMVRGGVELIELGLPYSDPVMDGPVIQVAAQAALAGGVRIKDVLHAVERVAALGVPTMVMTYWNPVLVYGVEKFAEQFASAGGAGLITPDLIPDEGQDWVAAASSRGLDRIFLVAPSSPAERLSYVVSQSSGFIYAASTMGITGTRASVGAGAKDLVGRTRTAGAEFVCVGLGVSNAAQAAEVASFADGVIVGSAFVKTLLTHRDDLFTAYSELERLAADLAAGVRSA